MDFPSKGYIAGLMDSLGRVKFHIKENNEREYSTRPELRFKTQDNDLIEGLLGTWFDKNNISYDFFMSESNSNKFSITSRQSLKDLKSFLQGLSTQLIRELEFTTGPYAEYYDFNILKPDEACKLIKSRDELYFDWQERGRYYTNLEDISKKYNVDINNIDPDPIPTGEFRDQYSPEYIAGIFDSLVKIRPCINEYKYGEIGYGMSPRVLMRRGGVHPAFATSVQQFCNSNNLDYSCNGDMAELHIYFIGPNRIINFVKSVKDYIISRYDDVQFLCKEILPGFEQGVHKTKQGFYDMLVMFDQIYEKNKKRERRYTLEYFEKEWKSEIKPQ